MTLFFLTDWEIHVAVNQHGYQDIAEWETHRKKFKFIPSHLVIFPLNVQPTLHQDSNFAL